MQAGIYSRGTASRRAKRSPISTRSAGISHEPPLTRTAAYEAAGELLRNADILMVEASADHQDDMARAIRVARKILQTPLSLLDSQYDDETHILLDVLDVEAILKGAAAVHARNEKGRLLREALRDIDEATTLLDCGGFAGERTRPEDMAPEPQAVTPARRVPLEQLHALLTEAAVLADETDESCKSIPNEFDEDQILRHIERLRDSICRLGWMADLSLKVIGENTIRGDAEHWLISFIARGEDNNKFLVLEGAAA